MKLIDFDHLDSNCDQVALSEALQELKRELKMRKQVYERQARYKPTQIDKFRKQYKRLSAIQSVIASMAEKEFNRRLTAAFGQGELFT